MAKGGHMRSGSSAIWEPCHIAGWPDAGGRRPVWRRLHRPAGHIFKQRGRMLGIWKEVVMVQDRNPMKTYNVTVETLMADGRIFHRAVYPIKAGDAEEAAAIVHNDLTLRSEPNFRISKVEEVKGNAD